MDDKIIVYFNDQYPHGYTTSNKQYEALEIAKTLTEITKVSWSFIAGSNHWKTGKPAYYTIWTDEEYNHHSLSFQ
jgi:hypothetical protein